MKNDSRIRREWAFVCIVATWPFLFLFPYTFGFVSPGNDFDILYYSYKLFYISSLAAGHLPLWNPMEAVGFPLFSNPFVQAIYPLNLVYLLHYRILNGLSYWDYTLYTIAAFSIYGVGLYCWLRRLNIRPAVVLASVLIALMSLKLTETLRFPNAAHTAAWMPWLLYGITVAIDSSSLLKGSAVVGLASFMLLTAGYPYFVVYAIFLLVPYTLAMLWAPSREAFFRSPRTDSVAPIRFLSCLSLAVLIAGLAAYPWLRQVQLLMAQTVDRGIASFDYATNQSGNLLDTIGSFLFPPAATIEGWHYFGVLPTLLIVVYIISLASKNIGLSAERRLVAMLIPWMTMAIYFTWGRNSILFQLVWPHVPILNQMRIWPRMNIVLIPAITLLAALSMSFIVGLIQHKEDFVQRLKRRAIVHVIVAGSVVLVIQLYFLNHRVFSTYWIAYIKPRVSKFAALGWAGKIFVRFHEYAFLPMTILGALMLIGLIYLAGRQRWITEARMLTAFIVFSFVDLFLISNIQWARPVVAVPRTSISIFSVIRDGFERPRVMAQGTANAFEGTQYAIPLSNWDFQRYSSVFSRYFDYKGQPLSATEPREVEAVQRLLGTDQKGQRIFFSRTIDHSSPADFMADVDASARRFNTAIDVLNYNGDMLSLSVRSGENGWLSFIDNWDENWTASVDEQPVRIDHLFGSYKSVPVPAGQRRVKFVFRPRVWSTAGVD